MTSKDLIKTLAQLLEVRCSNRILFLTYGKVTCDYNNQKLVYKNRKNIDTIHTAYTLIKCYRLGWL